MGKRKGRTHKMSSWPWRPHALWLSIGWRSTSTTGSPNAGRQYLVPSSKPIPLWRGHDGCRSHLPCRKDSRRCCVRMHYCIKGQAKTTGWNIELVAQAPRSQTSYSMASYDESSHPRTAARRCMAVMMARVLPTLRLTRLRCGTMYILRSRNSYTPYDRLPLYTLRVPHIHM
jgi:hypothetical protein